MLESRLLKNLPAEKATAIRSLYETAVRRLDHSPRFRFFTLHGERHLSELFRITDLLIEGGLEIAAQESFLFAAAICIHDLGMVTALRESDLEDIFEGKPYSTDPAIFESVIRNVHNDLIENVVQKDFSLFAGLGFSASELSQVIEISRCHRKVNLQRQSGFIQYLGALLRLVDELDIGPSRAPLDVLTDIRPSLDPTSSWHWFKHSITERWDLHNNLQISKDYQGIRIVFQLRIHPPSIRSVPYWLHQIRRPVLRALKDNGCAHIIRTRFNLRIEFEADEDNCNPANIDQSWQALEEYAMSSGRKTVLLIDDEARKMEDLLVPTMDDYHVLFAANARDAFEKVKATHVDLAIVDLQIGSGSIWSAEETGDFKKTGIEIVRKLNAEYPYIKVVILSGTKHDVSQELNGVKYAKFLKKPIRAEMLRYEVRQVFDEK